MTNEELVLHFRSIGHEVKEITGQDKQQYIVIRNYRIPAGSLTGKVCNVAVLKTTTTPYVAPAAIHTNPPLVPMDMNSRYRTQQSGIGPTWQYWSRVLRVTPTPRAFVAHIATIFSEV